jgi:hypothetical protein
VRYFAVNRFFERNCLSRELVDITTLSRVVIQFAQDLSLRFEMTDYLACHFERIARNLSLLYNVIHSNCTTTAETRDSEPPVAAVDRHS